MPYDNYFGSDIDTSLFLLKMLQDGSGIDRPAAIILETIQGEGGVNVASKKWLRNICKIAKEHNILLIVDDIQAGCGRSGKFFSFEDAQIKPDIVVLSKSISGYGIPMSLLLFSPEIDVWEPGEHNGTFRGNNHAFITAEAAISNFWTSKQFILDLEFKQNFFTEILNDFEKNTNIILRGRGFFRGIEFTNNNFAKQVSKQAFKRGLLIETAGINDQILKLLPALTISTEELKEGVDIIIDIFKSLR